MQVKAEQKLKQLFDEHFHQLVFLSLKYTSDYEQAEEIVQDVFVKIWQNLDRIGKIQNPKSYLYKAVKNSSINFIKHIKVRQKFINDSESSSLTTEKSPEELYTQSETINRISQAINNLPTHWKDAFILSKYKGLKYSEIADEMNISIKTVEKYISKALKVLREELKDLILLFILFIEFL